MQSYRRVLALILVIVVVLGAAVWTWRHTPAFDTEEVPVDRASVLDELE
jgi:hypothetical protein